MNASIFSSSIIEISFQENKNPAHSLVMVREDKKEEEKARGVTTVMPLHSLSSYLWGGEVIGHFACHDQVLYWDFTQRKLNNPVLHTINKTYV